VRHQVFGLLSCNEIITDTVNKKAKKMAVINKNKILTLANSADLLGSDFEIKNIKGSSYDLRIGTIYKKGEIYSENHPNDSISFIKIKPSEIVTMLTLEVVNIPPNMVATVFAINRMSSKGLLILNPGHIDPGFKGPISICAINLSKEPFKLSLGDDIFTIVFSELDTHLNPSDLFSSGFNSSDRKGYEKKYDKNSFSNLSNSFFDLIVGYEKSKKLLIKKLVQNFWGLFKKTFTTVAIAISIIAGFYSLIPKSFIFGDIKEIKENYNEDISKKDSIIKIKDSIINRKELEIKQLKIMKSPLKKQ
jgi:deoxycytidine triphosphate deaminase